MGTPGEHSSPLGGRLRRATGGLVTGRVWDAAAPDARLGVKILVDGNPARVVRSCVTWRRDLGAKA